ncbi:MAG: hypothetical protein A2365_02900 [Candidatus Nealsonbacteria bacterium RIFOXYB1_FULL_40_15]|uniref:ZIP family metal transporter n=2 Tax=Candidatus Nealsoniibacteriota TaxID=1817911 RepID=A0A1G2ERM5_9BACT|nr:MAG: hypothetical protein A2365_02900 [Candidatus Nealsonbacteria bacterium RIFOXYB1_FULL_40_15]OGZ28446.1 MAG: hypothetical protein A2427_02525 [Candidatus Nealsonbacteria bacterium RIFOXYC1_FULL_40_7]OGZ29857.1 MAG: hypothetical protein A2562_01935 [Candidatus Nealsonbacteria bacterium RIFOXYD1_FULL_39_11]
MILLYIITSTFIVSLISFTGILAFILKENILAKINLFLVAFSAGALLGGAFFHLIPESFQEAESAFKVSFFILLGFCGFFVLEQFINWHHCHKTVHLAPFSYLILFSDAIHNIIDGAIIAASFIVSIPLGIATTMAVILHEVPQEIGDFGVLVYGGFKKTTALIFNFLSGITAVLGGIAGFYLYNKGYSVENFIPFAAGGFIYISSADLIPEIKNRCGLKTSVPHFFAFLSGICIMLLLGLF